MNPTDFSSRTATVQVTIGSGGTASTVADLGGGVTPVALITPSTLTGTAFTFQTGIVAGTLRPVHQSGSEKSETVGVDQHVLLSPTDYHGIGPFFQVVSAAPETDDRVITIVAQP